MKVDTGRVISIAATLNQTFVELTRPELGSSVWEF